ncbi:MAG: DUF1488 domain-containing protein [Pararobbsia sp.]
MDISFPHDTSTFRGTNLTIVFPALVDGKRIECAISAEALEDHFGAQSARETDLLAAFVEHRPAIEQAARRLFAQLGDTPLLLRSGYLRFAR